MAITTMLTHLSPYGISNRLAASEIFNMGRLQDPGMAPGKNESLRKKEKIYALG
jgi:hypothetical protein